MKNWKDEEGKCCGLMAALPWQLRPEIGGKGKEPTDIYSKYPAKKLVLRHLCLLELLGKLLVEVQPYLQKQ
jgi:hypothetical protein